MILLLKQYVLLKACAYVVVAKSNVSRVRFQEVQISASFAVQSQSAIFYPVYTYSIQYFLTKNMPRFASKTIIECFTTNLTNNDHYNDLFYCPFCAQHLQSTFPNAYSTQNMANWAGLIMASILNFVVSETVIGSLSTYSFWSVLSRCQQKKEIKFYRAKQTKYFLCAFFYSGIRITNDRLVRSCSPLIGRKKINRKMN